MPAPVYHKHCEDALCMGNAGACKECVEAYEKELALNPKAKCSKCPNKLYSFELEAGVCGECEARTS